MKTVFLAVAVAAALAVSAASAGARTSATTMTLTCKVAPGATAVTGGITDRSHFRFQWWYANGKTYKSPVWVYYAASSSKARVWIPTHGHPTRALAIEHLPSGKLVRVKAACTR